MTDPQPIPETVDMDDERDPAEISVKDVAWLIRHHPKAAELLHGFIRARFHQARAEAREAALGPVTEGEKEAWRTLYWATPNAIDHAGINATNALLASRRDAVEPAGNEDWDGSG